MKTEGPEEHGNVKDQSVYSISTTNWGAGQGEPAYIFLVDVVSVLYLLHWMIATYSDQHHCCGQFDILPLAYEILIA